MAELSTHEARPDVVLRMLDNHMCAVITRELRPVFCNMALPAHVKKTEENRCRKPCQNGRKKRKNTTKWTLCGNAFVSSACKKILRVQTRLKSSDNRTFPITTGSATAFGQICPLFCTQQRLPTTILGAPRSPAFFDSPCCLRLPASLIEPSL